MEIDGTKRDLENGRMLADLIEAYKTDKVSSFHRLRYHTRRNQVNVLNRLVADYGGVELGAIKHRVLVEWHMKWSENGKKLSMAHSFIAAIRTICGFGASMLEDEQCERGRPFNALCVPGASVRVRSPFGSSQGDPPPPPRPRPCAPWPPREGSG